MINTRCQWKIRLDYRINSSCVLIYYSIASLMKQLQIMYHYCNPKEQDSDVRLMNSNAVDNLTLTTMRRWWRDWNLWMVYATSLTKNYLKNLVGPRTKLLWNIGGTTIVFVSRWQKFMKPTDQSDEFFLKRVRVHLAMWFSSWLPSAQKIITFPFVYDLPAMIDCF